MPRYIDADSFLEKYGGWYTEEGTEEGFIGTIKCLVDAQPTLSPDDVRGVGEWVPDEYVYDRVKCSVCGSREYEDERTPFCPMCGRKMR